MSPPNTKQVRYRLFDYYRPSVTDADRMKIRVLVKALADGSKPHGAERVWHRAQTEYISEYFADEASGLEGIDWMLITALYNVKNILDEEMGEAEASKLSLQDAARKFLEVTA